MSLKDRIKKIFAGIQYFEEDKYMLGIKDNKLSVRGLYACKCGCGFNNISDGMIEKLQFMQDFLEKKGSEIDLSGRIESACRCGIHNAKKGGESDSEHLLGKGVDISPVKGSRERFIIVQAAIHAGINRIGIGKNLVHLGIEVEPGKDSDVIWLY